MYVVLFPYGLSAENASGYDYAGLRISMEEVSIICLFLHLSVSFIGHFFHKDCSEKASDCDYEGLRISMEEVSIIGLFLHKSSLL